MWSLLRASRCAPLNLWHMATAWHLPGMQYCQHSVHLSQSACRPYSDLCVSTCYIAFHPTITG